MTEKDKSPPGSVGVKRTQDPQGVDKTMKPAGPPETKIEQRVLPKQASEGQEPGLAPQGYSQEPYGYPKPQKRGPDPYAYGAARP